MELTGEQQAIVKAATTGANLVVQAGAGCGKSSTLRHVAAHLPGKRILYVAFNRDIVAAAHASGMPANVECRTAHSVARRAVVTARYQHRLNMGRQTGKQIAAILGITQPIIAGETKLAPAAVARLAKEAIIAYCQSDAIDVQDQHIRVPHALAADPAAAAAFRATMRPIIDAYRADIRSATGRLAWTHDTYLKMFQLRLLRAGNPHLGYDVVLLDEGQDTNPVTQSAYVDLQMGAGAQIIAVGDSSQSIYAWRGAVDCLALIEADERLTLSKSFRFGPAIAAEANKWLTLLGADLRLTGHDPIPSTVGRVNDPQAILCRTNGEAMAAVMDTHREGRKPALAKGFGEILSMTYAARDLKQHRPADHPDFAGFTTWSEVQGYADQEADGGDLKVFVNLVDEYGCDEIIHVASLYRDVTDPDVTISTAHGAKGLEWDRVRVASDFRSPKQDAEETGELVDPEEMRLAYVTVTRAKRTLDRGSLAWVDDYLPGQRHLAAV